MNARDELPEPLRSGAFSSEEGREAGLSRSRMDGIDLVRPFRGVRRLGAVVDHVDLCRAYAPLMRDWYAISGVSALLVHGLPWLARLPDPSRVHVAVPTSRTPPTGVDVQGLRIRDDLWCRTTVQDVVVTPPLTTWLTLARHLREVDLTILADALVTASPRYPGRFPGPPLATPRELLDFVSDLKGVTGAPALRRAAARARIGVDSPMETVLRCLLVDAGLPEPEVNGAIDIGGDDVHGDLVYRAAGVILEYEGDEHRRDADRFRGDITRVRILSDLGWHVIRVTADDLGGAARDRLIADVRRLLSLRTRPRA